MRAGKLDRRVAVEIRDIAQSDSGEAVEGWTPVGTFWMGKRDARALERFSGAERVAEIDTVFKARWLPLMRQLRPDTHRLVYRGRVHEIMGVTELGRAEGVEIACMARAEAAFGA
jgi:head-tail adaptor